MFAFSFNTESFILIAVILVCQFNLFGTNYCSGFVNMFNVDNDFNATSNFKRLLNFAYSFGS